jgi:riboflavin kinase/FMN adenylyltransferase
MRVFSSEIEGLVFPAEWAERQSTLTIGSFDGIHRGHQFLIRRLVAQAREEGRLAGLVTFYPHPAAVLHPQRLMPSLTTPGEKTALLEPLGLDWVAILSFTRRLAATSSRDFVQHLYERVNMRAMWVGPDFALGRNREGNVDVLRRLGAEMGFQVYEVPYVSEHGEKVSSTHIRTLLHHGHVQKAASLLGRYYSLSGEVVHGAQRGRCLGFPTANMNVRSDRVIPADGIYAAYACLGEERYQAVVNIGVRPSFDNGERSIEAYLLDFEGDIYGCDLVIEFVVRLRPERRFPDVNDLVAQIGADVEQAQQVLGTLDRAPGTVARCQPSAPVPTGELDPEST